MRFYMNTPPNPTFPFTYCEYGPDMRRYYIHWSPNSQKWNSAGLPAEAEYEVVDVGGGYFEFVRKGEAKKHEGHLAPFSPEPTGKGPCFTHDFVKYEGFTETYLYCKHCDKKQETA